MAWAAVAMVGVAWAGVEELVAGSEKTAMG